MCYSYFSKITISQILITLSNEIYWRFIVIKEHCLYDYVHFLGITKLHFNTEVIFIILLVLLDIKLKVIFNSS